VCVRTCVCAFGRARACLHGFVRVRARVSAVACAQARRVSPLSTATTHASCMLHACCTLHVCCVLSPFSTAPRCGRVESTRRCSKRPTCSCRETERKGPTGFGCLFISLLYKNRLRPSGTVAYLWTNSKGLGVCVCVCARARVCVVCMRAQARVCVCLCVCARVGVWGGERERSLTRGPRQVSDRGEGSYSAPPLPYPTVLHKTLAATTRESLGKGC
jgi:hypothetical protein